MFVSLSSVANKDITEKTMQSMVLASVSYTTLDLKK